MFFTKLNLLVLLFSIGAQYFLRSYFVRFVSWLMAAVMIFHIGVGAYWSYEQYLLWSQHDMAKYFLPPYQGWGYFYSYTIRTFLGDALVALSAAILLRNIALHANKRFGERFFEPEESVYFGLAIFLCGYPGFLFYLLFLLIAAVAWSLICHIAGWGRAPLYFLWLPVAIFTIIVVQYFIPDSFLHPFIF